MNFTTVTNTLGHSAEAILNEDAPQHRSQRDWDSDHRPYYKYTAGGKENPQSVWLRRPGETWFYSGDRSHWEKLGYDLSPLFKEQMKYTMVTNRDGEQRRAVLDKNCPPKRGISGPWKIGGWAKDNIWIDHQGESGHFTFADKDFWEREEGYDLSPLYEKETEVKEAKYIAPRRYYGSVAELTHNVAKYIADSDRTGRHDHFGNLADLSFWKTHTVDEAVDILGGYIDSEKFCDDGKKRAFSYFNITKAKPEYEEVTVSCENLYNNFSQYHWFTPSSRPSRKVEQADVAYIPGGVMLTVLKEV